MKVYIATNDDFENWLKLAQEVESLFGSLVNEPKFHNALNKCIKEKRAYCIRENDELPGSKIIGGLLFSKKHPIYTIGWLAVSKSKRRLGVGTLLLEYALSQVKKPAELLVTTFGEDSIDGLPARNFYSKHGFKYYKYADIGPEGNSRILLKKDLI
jgi:GNAT superfamily N-acetyltransferase